ncbi:hypothetical protein [Geobacter sp. AOG1]|uniref:hypothetical protein n=1 Tax=Geobacter sp. AOG1 TaxID=1566346 RepID=UPI001CC6E982|nr:hypothetical protein [Geobacter sp. AOG1]GFE57741.1 hypothetical protein AOG1_16210 [Geobacter sp. AOG1]
MTSQREFQTESIDLASFLVTADFNVEVLRQIGSHRAVFSFADSDALRDAIIAYERGASLPAKRLLNCRSWLFREASRVVREGRI